MLRRIYTALGGFLAGVLVMEVTVVVLQMNNRMDLMPWIVGVTVLVLILIGVLLYFRFQKSHQPKQNS